MPSRVRASPEDILVIWLLYVTTPISFAHDAQSTGSLKVENGSKATDLLSTRMRVLNEMAYRV
jgi:hypothetical protein